MHLEQAEIQVLSSTCCATLYSKVEEEDRFIFGAKYLGDHTMRLGLAPGSKTIVCFVSDLANRER